MTTSITLPNLGENIESGDVLSLLVSEGDQVEKDQDLLEIETDKATVPIPSPGAGKIVKILVGEGATVQIGEPIMEIELVAPSGAPPAPSPQPTSAPAADTPPPATTPPATTPPATTPPATSHPPEAIRHQPPATSHQPPAPAAPAVAAPVAAPAAREVPQHDDATDDSPGDGHASAAAGPSVRRLARELGVDLRRVRPSGNDGRITTADVQAHVRTTNAQASAAAPSGVTPPGTPESDAHGAVRVEKMSRMRQTIARNMLASYTTIPQLTNFDDVDITDLEEIRQQSKADYAARGLKLSSMPFLIKAVASALKMHPVVNASIDAEQNQIIYKEYVNIGIAVDTDRGLVVPVLRDADRLSISNIARELARLAQIARDGSFAIEDLRGGTFTVSNLGAVGALYSTPIINPPEVAILLVGRSRELPMFVEGQLEPRLIMPLSLTYDHRIVDGAAAARFLNEVKGFLGAPGRLLLAP